MSAHTPAPWTWEQSRHGDYVELRPGVIEYAGCGSHAVTVSEADAHLIAAAPRMLDALIEAEFALRFVLAERGQTKHAIDTAPALVRIRAAIAKALNKSVNEHAGEDR